ncbi:MAG: hypothetical protein E7176_02225 [Erysipelotrichaceae bacterium]|nr:hypothetical protein [Erysipelotrichaceae bacterium]
MNVKDFNEIKEQFGQTMYAYEQFLKKGYLLEMMYNYHFYDYIVKEYKLNIENELLRNVLDMLNAKQSLDMVDAYIDNARKINAQNLISLDKKHRNATEVVNAMESMSEEDDEKLENEFKKFVMESHPAVKGTVTKEESNMYNQAKHFYIVNNLGAFNECRELFKNSFKPADIKEEDFEKISAYYYSTMQDLKLEANKRNNAFPYTIEGVFEDDVTISAENAEFKIKLKNLTEMNTALQKDAVEIFGEEIKLN